LRTDGNYVNEYNITDPCKGSDEDCAINALELYNIEVYSISSNRIGSAFFVYRSRKVYFGAKCFFHQNSFIGYDDSLPSPKNRETYGKAGGAVLSIIRVLRSDSVYIDGLFRQNYATYHSLNNPPHGNGGAIFIYQTEGKVVINGKFFENSANQGGAVFVNICKGSLLFDGVYKKNKAFFGHRKKELGTGGCLRVQNLKAGCLLNLKGRYEENFADKRGGVIATNAHEDFSYFILNADIHRNRAAAGAVWGSWSEGGSLKGIFIVNEASRISGNVATTRGSFCSIRRKKLGLDFFLDKNFQDSKVVVKLPDFSNLTNL
jgi:hypothetical protein